MIGLAGKEFEKFYKKCEEIEQMRGSEIPLDVLKTMEVYSKIGQMCLSVMVRLALKAYRPNSAQVWELLKDLMGDTKDVKKIRQFLETMARGEDTIPMPVTINITTDPDEEIRYDSSKKKTEEIRPE